MTQYRFFGLKDRQKNANNPSTPGAVAATTTTASPTGYNNSERQAAGVQGWLMNVPGYRDSPGQSIQPNHAETHIRNPTSMLVDADNNSIPLKTASQLRNGRPESISSASSGDSVNLDELIKNNFAEQVDDETDLPNLADLDLDDEAEGFWKMNDVLAHFRPSEPKQQQQQQQLERQTHQLSQNPVNTNENDDDLLSMDEPVDKYGYFGANKLDPADQDPIDWSPETDDNLETLSNASSYTSSRTAQPHHRSPSSARYHGSPESAIRSQRSGSLSSENSMTSQSTVTNQYARYGMTPMLYPSESTSNSSRSHSRMSDYSASSSQASSHASGLPRHRSGTSSSSHQQQSHTGLPTPSGAHKMARRSVDRMNETTRSSSRLGSHLSPPSTSHTATSSQSRLAKRATHVPMPSPRTAARPESVSASRSTGLSTSSRLPKTNTSSRIASRASHIPAPRRSTVSPEPRSPSLSPARPGSAAAGGRPLSPMGNTRLGGSRSPVPGPRNSIFGRRGSDHTSESQSNTRNDHTNRASRPPSAAGHNRPTGLRPPSSLGGTLSKIGRPKRT